MTATSHHELFAPSSIPTPSEPGKVRMGPISPRSFGSLSAGLQVIFFTTMLPACTETPCPSGSIEVEGVCQASTDRQADAAADEDASGSEPCHDDSKHTDGSCIAFDPCSEDAKSGGPCDANATCMAPRGAAVCACDEGYEGDGKLCLRNPCVSLSGDPERCPANQHCRPKNTVEVECSCREGFEDCDGKASNGCEVDLARDSENCGACGFNCAQGLACTEGTCEQRVVELSVSQGFQPVEDHCGISPRGELVCAGYAKGQGPLSLSSNPVEQIANNGVSWCVRSGNTLFCQGSNASSLLGTSDDQATSHKLTLHGLQDISVGRAHACVVVDGKVYCWGSGRSGQLGDGYEYTPEASSRPYSALRPVLTERTQTPLTGVVRVAAGSAHTCALLETGRVRCWGTTIKGAPAHLAQAIVAEDGSGELDDAESVCAGEYYGCAVRKDGSAACWGQDPVSSPAKSAYFRPLTLPPSKSFSCNVAHACAVTPEGSLYCWGNGSLFGLYQIPYGSDPTLVEDLTDVLEVATGSASICTRHRNGRMYCKYDPMSFPDPTPKEIVNWP